MNNIIQINDTVYVNMKYVMMLSIGEEHIMVAYSDKDETKYIVTENDKNRVERQLYELMLEDN